MQVKFFGSINMHRCVVGCLEHLPNKAVGFLFTFLLCFVYFVSLHFVLLKSLKACTIKFHAFVLGFFGFCVKGQDVAPCKCLNGKELKLQDE